MLEERKTIVIFSCFYEPFMSGAERFVKETVERLSNRYRFIVITAKLRLDLKNEEDFGSYKVIRVGRGDKWDKIRYIYLAPQEAKKHNPDIIHAVMESYAGLALWRAKRVVRGVKRILTLQSGDLDAKLWSKIPFLWSGMHKSPDYVTAISNFLAKRAKKLGAKNITVIPNGVGLDEVKDILANKQNSENKHKIICLARLSWEKDHKNLIAAMPKILEKYPDTELVLVGDGSLKESLQLTAESLKLKDKIKFLGNLPHKTALEELAKADVSICPSLAEGLGITFIEAQVLGVPVIGTRVGGIPDVIIDGETGFLIESNSSEAIANSIFKVFSLNEDEKNKIIEKAKIVAAEKFDWNKISANIDAIYNNLLIS